MIQHRRIGAGLSSRFWSSQDGHSGPEKKQKYEKAEDIAVCLTCTKARCRGTRECFRKRKTVGCAEDEDGT